jgi:predicted nucleotidyltransferase
MSNISFDLSEKIEPEKVEALSIIRETADSLGIKFFIVGAMARDIILEHCYGIIAPRRTMDIDLGVEVAGWDQYHQLTRALTEAGRFSPTAEPHRFLSGGIRIDIVPFGQITDERMRISWPPEHAIFMSMLGFEEAYEYSADVRLSSDPELDVKVPSLPGLAIMKLISWEDGYPERGRDAKDLLLIMLKYEEAGNRDRLYGEEQDLLQEEKFDTVNAGARLLGRDMAKIANPDTLSEVKHILENETSEQSQYKLISDMTRGTGEKFEMVLRLVEKLRQGIEEG